MFALDAAAGADATAASLTGTTAAADMVGGEDEGRGEVVERVLQLRVC